MANMDIRLGRAFRITAFMLIGAWLGVKVVGPQIYHGYRDVELSWHLGAGIFLALTGLLIEARLWRR